VVVKSVKDEWLDGKMENATVKIVIHHAGLDNGLLQFGTEQLACNLTRCKEKFDIHVEDQTYTILSPFMGRGDKKSRNGFLRYKEWEGSISIQSH
jgi:hypothetical protein